MLVLSREPGQTIVITTPRGERITVVVNEIRDRDRVRIGVEADAAITIHRGEVQEKIDR